jgi:hypothetical protein
MPWWGPLAIIGGALVGALVGYLLLYGTGSKAPAPTERDARLGYQTTDTTNYTRWNPAAFVVIFAIVALIVGLSIGLAAG